MTADGLLLGWVLLAFGAQTVLPWRLAELDPEQRHPGALALLPLLLTGGLAAALYATRHPDAAVVQGLFPLGVSKTGRILAVLLPALAVSGLLLAFGWRRLDRTGWRIAAGLGLVLLLAVSWAGELMRTGEGPASALLPLILLTLLRSLLALGAAEALAPGRPTLAVAAGPGLLLYGLLLPAQVARALGDHGQWLTLAAAALLLLGARWYPAPLRRPALLGAALLAGLYLGQAARLSAELGTLLPG